MRPSSPVARTVAATCAAGTGCPGAGDTGAGTGQGKERFSCSGPESSEAAAGVAGDDALGGIAASGWTPGAGGSRVPGAGSRVPGVSGSTPGAGEGLAATVAPGGSGRGGTGLLGSAPAWVSVAAARKPVAGPGGDGAGASGAEIGTAASPVFSSAGMTSIWDGAADDASGSKPVSGAFSVPELLPGPGEVGAFRLIQLKNSGMGPNCRGAAFTVQSASAF
jgi:hypothetical protein